MSAQHFHKTKYTPPNTSSAYAANEVFGAPQMVIINPNLGVECYVDHIDLVLEHTAGLDFEIVIQSKQLATPQTDNNAMAIVPAEYRAGYVADLSFVVADFKGTTGSNIFTVSKSIPPFIIKGGKEYLVIVKTAAGITLAASALDIYFNTVEMEVGEC